ncbi:MAG: type II toxin-antitoxin system HicA family toxin [Spirochaetales bacterium]|nr:type II toxin-antitoxin system HicA family toxin [Spirochaetales bacterium]
MGKLEKRIRKLVSQPNNGDYEELRYVLLGIGCSERMGGKGSHVIFTHQKAEISITVPIQKPLRRSYVLNVIKLFGLKETYDEIIGRLS